MQPWDVREALEHHGLVTGPQ